MLLKLILTISIIFLASFAKAQIDTVKHWQTSGKVSVQLNQSHFSNWAGGGHTALSLSGNLELDANYQKGKLSWINKISEFYGISKLGKGTKFFKNHDVLEINSRLTLAHKPRTHFVVFGNLISQLANGYHQEADGLHRISGFLSPAYITEGLGYEFRSLKFTPDNQFFVVLSPLAGKQTVVLSKKIEETNFGLQSQNSVRHEFGAYLQGGLKKEVLERTHISTQVLFFTNYTEDFGNVDVNWKTQLEVLANKWISMTLTTHLVYDHDVSLPTFEDVNFDGDKEVVSLGPKLQFMEVLGLGLTAKF